MLEFSNVERISFIVVSLVFLSILVFLARKPFKLIVSGKPEQKSRTDRMGERLVRVVKEVLFQQRVLQGRPVAGTLHFAVFIAFLAFVVETIHMFFEPFGLDILSSVLGGMLPGFRAVMIVIASLAALGIIGLALRRFVFVKHSPDPKSIESLVVALFILVLMLTYIDLHGTGVLSARINWWVHVFIILTFPILIVNSKHLHLFLAPVSIFFRNFHLWEVPKMNLDIESAESEDDIQLGLETVEQIPWKLRLDFFSCVECKRCTDSCPAAQAGQELRPADFIIAGRKALMEGKHQQQVIGTIISQTALGQCTSCMACESVCPVGVEHSQLLAGAKAAQTLAIGSGGVATEFFKTMENNENPFAAAPDVRDQLIEELDIPVYKNGETKHVLWLGCVWAYNPDYKNIVRSTVEILKRGKVSFGVLKSEKCSGHHSRRQGEEMQFQMLADENANVIKENNIEKIITGCPHCLYSLRHEYKDYIDNKELELKHHSQIFTELIVSGAIKMKENSEARKSITYHDPCYLGRYEGVFDDPRNIIESSGNEIIEMSQSRARSYCCGGGAAGFTIEAETEQRVDQNRKDQIRNTGAETLVTGCPECRMMLNGAAASTKDISELLFESIDNS